MTTNYNCIFWGSETSCFYNETYGGTYQYFNGDIDAFMTAKGAVQGDATTWDTSVSLTVANAVFGSSAPFNSGDSPFMHYVFAIEEIDDQRIRVMFYPTGNIQDGIPNQRIRVMFYPTGNMQNSDGSALWRWWQGMRFGTRKRYGTNHIRRIRL